MPRKIPTISSIARISAPIIQTIRELAELEVDGNSDVAAAVAAVVTLSDRLLFGLG